MNKVMIIGFLGKDPEIRFMPNGDAVASFSVASSERWTDKKTGEKMERTEWHRCSMFGKRAEAFEKFVKKGHRIYVEGQMRTRKYQDKTDGKDRYTTEVLVRDFEFLQSKGTSQPPHPADDPNYGNDARKRTSSTTNEPHNDGAPPHDQPPTGGGGGLDYDDDIPF